MEVRGNDMKLRFHGGIAGMAGLALAVAQTARPKDPELITPGLPEASSAIQRQTPVGQLLATWCEPCRDDIQC